MIIDEAIEILDILSLGSHDTYINKHKIVAIKLGIEALKAMKILRSPASSRYPHILPGETKG